MEIHYFNLLIWLVLILNIPFISNNREFNIFSYTGAENKIGEATKNTMINRVLQLQNIFKNNTEIVESANKCIQETKGLYKTHTELFFQMFLYSGVSGANSFGKYSSCIDLNSKYPNQSLVNFIIFEEHLKEKERIFTGVCVPSCCSDFVSSLKKRKFTLKYEKTYTVTLFYKGKNDRKGGILNILANTFWVLLLVVYIAIVLLLNIIMNWKYSNFNPYDMNHLMKNNKKVWVKLCDFSSDNEILNSINFLKLLEDDYDDKHRDLSVKQETIGSLHNFYYDYLSLNNNLYLLKTIKNPIYNDSKLRLVNGMMTFFSLFHVMCCSLDLLQILSNEDKLTENSDLLMNPLLFIFPLFKNYGKLWHEVLALLWGFLITFKYLHFTDKDKDYNYRNLKTLKWFFRSFDKVIIFILINLWFVVSIDFIMHAYFEDNIIWFLFDKNAKNCSYWNFLPLYDFYILIKRGENITHRCMKSNSLFFQGLYVFTFTISILKFISKSKKKFRSLIFLLFISFMIRTSIAIICSNIYHDEGFYSPVYVIDVLHMQFFYNIPNLILGIICGYVYYCETQIESIHNRDLSANFEGFDVIRNCFYRSKFFKNVSFFFCLSILFFYCGFINSILEFNYIKNYVCIFSILLSLNGFITTLMISIILLSIKLKGVEFWEFNKVLVAFFKIILKSDLFLIMARSMFTFNLGHIGLTYLIVTLFIENSIIFDFFTVFELYGVTIFILVYCLSFVITVFIEVPLRVFFRKIFK